MRNTVQICDNTHWIGVNDRTKERFENLWPLHKGVSYNSYIINDEKTAVIDSVDSSKLDDFLDNLESILLGKELDYLVVNHTEPDHSGALRAILNRYPKVQVIGNRMTFKILDAFYPMKYNRIIVKNGDEIKLGEHTLRFYLTPWVHWPETMMTHDEKTKTLFTGDAFGSFGAFNGGIFDDVVDMGFFENEMRRYYSNIVGKYTRQTQKVLQKLSGVDVEMLAPTHGVVWRKDLNRIVNLYNDWSTYKTEPGVVIAFGSMYGNTEKMADFIARKLSECGVKKIRVYDASKTHMSYIISDIWKYKGVILGSPAYNGSIYPAMGQLITEIEHLEVKDHLLGVFGSSAWSGGGVKTLMDFSERIGWDMVADPIEAKGSPKPEMEKACILLAENMAAKLKGI